MSEVHSTYNRTIELNDETVLKGQAGLNSTTEHLWVWIEPGKTMLEMMMMFSDPGKTAVIKVNRTDEYYDTYSGYTILTSISQDADGTITICLKK